MDLIDNYTSKGLTSDPTRHFRPCNGCNQRFHPDDLHTRDVMRYGEHDTIEVCDECNTDDEPARLTAAADIDVNDRTQPARPAQPDSELIAEINRLRNEIREDDLTSEQIETIHCFGECWIKDYDRWSRMFWERALWLWAWDREVIWNDYRKDVPFRSND